MRRYPAALTALAVLSSLPVALDAQRTITRSIFVSAVDSTGKPVLDLTAEEFGVAENEARRPVVRATLGTEPLRIVLMVDSSTAIAPMVSTVKKGLTAFVETLSPGHEIAFISSGGQIRVRARPGDTRARLYAEIGRFSSEGGANAFLDTLLEADTRFLKPVPAQWPVVVIVTTDNGDTNREPDVATYNKFMNDFVARGGAAHAIILIGKRSGPVTDLVSNLVDNAGGFRQTVNTENSLPERLTEIAERLDIGHRAMLNRYEIAYAGNAAATTPIVNVTVSRPDVRLVMSPRRPF
jgi:hypothetical protein